VATKKQATTDRRFSDFESDIIEGLLSGKPLGGRDGVFTNLIKHVVEAAMDAELGNHLQFEASQLDANPDKRNGKAFKRIKTDFGEARIKPSRDRTGTYEPQTVGKWQLKLGLLVRHKIFDNFWGRSFRCVNKYRRIFHHRCSTLKIGKKRQFNNCRFLAVLFCPYAHKTPGPKSDSY